MSTIGEKHRIVIADDEPDVAAVTRLSLKGLNFGKPIEFHAVATGKEAVEALRRQPDTAVLLLDVVMETQTAGLDACRTIRNELGNRFVRILLRTGQPGVAPERTAIEQYDIDGYLPKAELTTNRLYAAVRAALKSYDELVELERHRAILNLVHQSVLALHSYEPLEATLQRVLGAAVGVAPSPLAVLHLTTIEEGGAPREWLLHIAVDEGDAPARVDEIVHRVSSEATSSQGDARRSGEGTVVPITLQRNLGGGWLYVDRPIDDDASRAALVLLASHAANALYSAVAQSVLSQRERPFYDSLIV